MGELADEILSLITKLKSKVADSSSIRVCLVIDGEPLPAKKSTHKHRSHKSYSHLKKARKSATLYLGLPHADNDAVAKFKAKFRANAFGWIRWFANIKDLLVEQLCARGVSLGFDPNNDAEFSIVVSAYEADPMCVEIGRQVPQSIIFSPDGDLIVYPYADKSPVY